MELNWKHWYYFILFSLFLSCSSQKGLELRHERKLARIEASKHRPVTNNNYTTPYHWNGPNNWYWDGFGFSRPQIVIPIRYKKRNNGNTTNNNSRGGRNRIRGSVPVRVPKVQKPVQPRTLPVRPRKGIIKNKQ